MVNIAHKVTSKRKHKVMLLTATGMTHEMIAAVLKIDPVTLRKYYWHELHVGRATIQEELREMLMKAARKGNVSAIKHLEGKADPQTPPRQYVGKKEHQAQAAAVAGLGTEWEADLMRVMPQADDKPN